MMNKGFSLIELLIVVAIIGNIAAIATVNFRDAQIQAKVTQSYAIIKTLDTSIQQFQLDHNVMLIAITL